MSSPKVSIIINCFNGERYLAEAMDSVFCQTYEDWEIIFWDNASTDNCAEIAKSYGERIRYFKSSSIYPLGKARNLAIENARGDFMAFLDCDDLWFPQKLEKQMYKHAENLEFEQAASVRDKILHVKRQVFGEVISNKN